MKIIHKLDDFIFTIFPDIKGVDKEEITKYLIDFYTEGIHKPKVVIENDIVIIDIDDIAIDEENNDYRNTVALCEQGKYNEAKPILNRLLQKNPTNSEYYRIMGQILSDEGNQDEAINYLINALRWDSKNGWALLMMGNIFIKFKDDLHTAMKYYNQALIANPNDIITINNIGANLMQQDKLEEAKNYFWKAIKINDSYPNSHHALGIIASKENDLESAFNSFSKAIKLNNKQDVLYQNSVGQAFEIANKLVSRKEGTKIFRGYRVKLEAEGEREIEIVNDDKIQTAAKFEFAENHNRESHVVKINPKYPAFEHLVMHELVHLDLTIQARKDNLNQLFISTQDDKRRFIKDLEPEIKKLKKMGLTDKDIDQYCASIFDGINGQTYNTPIDLFIENFLYLEFTELRPYQFISLHNMLQESIRSVTDKKIVSLSPKNILSKSKVYNLVNAMQFRELYGVDFIKEFHATPVELNVAENFYKEYLEYRDDKEPAEEYELVLHWAEDLKLDNYFELVSEDEHRKSSSFDDIISSIEDDPLGIKSKDPYKERAMEKFQKSQQEIGTNMAVVMFMVDALQFFNEMPKEQIKEIAIEIALQGTQGYSPDKKDYIISSIPSKTFSGYHILAYYYVSWALATPEMLSQLQLPFEDEYKLAQTMHKPSNR